MSDPEHQDDGAEERPSDGGGGEGDGEGDGGEEDESNLLFSCQCDSARSVGTLLSCLRRVLTSGAPSSFAHVQPSGGTQRATQGGQTQSTSAGGGGSSSSSGKVQHATVYAGPKGLTVHVQHGLARQSQCSVDLPRGLFREYFVGEEEVWVDDDEDENGATLTAGGDGGGGGGRREVIRGGEFGINLTTVLECFSVLSRSRPSSSSAGHSGGEYASLDRVPLCMSYDRGTATFHLEFLDGGGGPSGGNAPAPSGGCLVTCEVPGVAVADDVDGTDDDGRDGGGPEDGSSGLAAAFRSSPLAARAILHSDALAAAVSELYDVPGASVVRVRLEKGGLEMGTVGPRSEAWVTVPYGRGQGGVYVGLEVYDDGGSGRDGVMSLGLTHTQAGADGVRSYPLGAFLSGMRGLDIGVETCVSLNADGMMAIQHQVSKEGYHDLEGSGGDAPASPSFVDFIMTCIEDVPEDRDGGTAAASQTTDDDTATIGTLGTGGMSQESDLFSRGGRGRRAGADGVPTGPGRRQQRPGDIDEGRRTTIPRRNGRHRGDLDSTQSDDEEEFDATSTGDGVPRRSGQRAKSQEEEAADEAARAASRILGELEVDGDMMTSSIRGVAGDGGRRTALEDIRRRRRERRAAAAATDGDGGDDSDGGRGTKRGPGGGREDEGSDHPPRRRRGGGGRAHGSPSQSEEDEEEDDDHTDDEDLDVTAGWRGGRGEEDRATETRLMYGNTRVEFTQDSD